MTQSRTLPRAFRAATVVLAASCALAAKCFPYDERLAPVEAADAGVTGGTQHPCPAPDEAHLAVEEYAYPILCGCLEPPWTEEGEGSQTCTIPLGTTVVWSFRGSLEHNVTSDGSAVLSSDDRAAGAYRFRPTKAGEYAFKCTLHGGQMAGYRIVVMDDDGGGDDAGTP